MSEYKLTKKDLGEYFLLKNGRVYKFIAKDNDTTNCYLFECITELNDEVVDGQYGTGKIIALELIYGRYGRRGRCQYYTEHHIISKIGNKDNLMVHLL